MPIELAHATATTGMLAATTILAVTRGPRRPNRLHMYAEQIVLSSNSTCRIRFHLCKKTGGS